MSSRPKRAAAAKPMPYYADDYDTGSDIDNNQSDGGDDSDASEYQAEPQELTSDVDEVDSNTDDEAQPAKRAKLGMICIAFQSAFDLCC